MTLANAIERIDHLKHNIYEVCDKVKWLSELDGMIKLEIIDTHEGGENIQYNGYDEGTDMNTELLVPAPWDDLYIKWLEAKIDYIQMEYKKYNNSVAAFNTAYEAFAKWYNRTHMPRGAGGFKF